VLSVKTHAAVLPRDIGFVLAQKYAAEQSEKTQGLAVQEGVDEKTGAAYICKSKTGVRS
jgi:hypothetical protein